MKPSIVIIAIVMLLAGLSGFCEDSTLPHVEYYLDVASVYKEVMDYDKAIETLQKIPALEANDKVKKLLGRLYYLNGKSNDALAVYETVKDKDWVTESYLGLIYEDLGQIDAAITHYQASLRQRTNSLALFRLGKLFYENNNLSDACRYFNQLVNFEPSIRVATVYLGECLAKLGNYKDAYTYYARSINYFPQNEEVKTQLFMVKRKMGSQIIEHLQDVVEGTRKAVKLAFYPREENIPTIHIGIATGLKEISFKCPGSFKMSDKKTSLTGTPETLYTITIKNKTFLLFDKKKTALATFHDSVKLEGRGHPFYLYDISYGKGNFWHKIIDRTYRGDFLITNNKNAITLINEVSLEEYLYGVLAAEIQPNAGAEALRAQAIAARSLAVASLNKRHKSEGFDVCADVHCQVYQGLSVETPQTVQAVKDTRGQILTYNNNAIEAFYCSNCGGCLKSDLFGGKIPFLETHFDTTAQSVTNEEYRSRTAYKEDSWFIEAPETFCNNPAKSNFRWQRIYDAQDFLMSFGFPLTQLKKIVPLEKDDCFHYNTVKVITANDTQVIVGDANIRSFFDKLRSSACRFEIKYSATKVPQLLIIWGAGFGHSGGLCQEGAEVMAKSGFSYREILKHYYPRATISSLY